MQIWQHLEIYEYTYGIWVSLGADSTATDMRHGPLRKEGIVGTLATTCIPLHCEIALSVLSIAAKDDHVSVETDSSLYPCCVPCPKTLNVGRLEVYFIGIVHFQRRLQHKKPRYFRTA